MTIRKIKTEGGNIRVGYDVEGFIQEDQILAMAKQVQADYESGKTKVLKSLDVL